MFKRILTNSKGMTLLEVLLAVAIMGIISMGVLTMFTSSFRFIVRAGDRSVATYEAKSDAEQALTQKNTDLGASGVVITFSDGTTVTGPGKIQQASETVNGVTVDVPYLQPTY